MRIGVDYYPEQWDRNMWFKDAELMSRTGVKIVRIAEFSWCRLEPEEGVFNFDWLSEVVSVFSNYGIDIVMCTPTNCPPMWMYEKHPEIIQVGRDGNRQQIGIRGHRCINSPIFLEYAKRIVSEMAKRYANNPTVVAWQIDNEPEAYECCCQSCAEKFRCWLEDKYDTLENINNAFGNVVWSGEFTNRNQINPPASYNLAWQNPSMLLEYSRFSSDCTAAYLRLQSDLIKQVNVKAFITTNASFSGNTPDFYKLYDGLSFVSYDNYPPVRINENYDEHFSASFFLDLMRGVKRSNFWVMEQLSGSTGSWSPMSPTTRPNMLKGYGLQCIAHGADTILFFRWRTALKGAEMHWHGLIDHSNVLGRRFFEFEQFCKISAKLDSITDTKIISDIAIIYAPDCASAFKIQPQSDGFDYLRQLQQFHKAFTKYGANVDVVGPDADLSDYSIVIAPALYVYNKNTVENIYRFTMGGGTCILTCRSGVKDSSNNCIMEQLPTCFNELVGAVVSEYDPIGNTVQTITDNDGNDYSCSIWCDVMKTDTAKTYAQYADSFYALSPAVTLNNYCKGKAYYIGTVCEQKFYSDFANKIMKEAGIPRLRGMPDGMEVTTRTNGVDDFIFFFNNSEKSAVIGLPKPLYSLIDGVSKDRIELKPFDMEIVRK
ncbi:MAG: beta-galactosidase [Ruminococcus sp.]|jgi:beta-galactosidase|nr:beta-galactosidase [Ruminococcus sp.]